MKLPCGRCIGCKITHGQNWAVRCLHESQLHKDNAFLTLTYATELPKTRIAHRQEKRSLWTNEKSAAELPTNAGTLALIGAPEDANVDNSPQRKKLELVARALKARLPPPEGGEGRGLSKKDHQKFIKRYRKKVGPLRYYMCGEYGSQLSRPHYHYLIFGHNFADRRPWKKSDSGELLYRSATLEELWPYGYSWIGNVTYDSCAYVAGYVTKKITGDLATEHYKRIDTNGCEYWVIPEFNEMSRNPGIARDWWLKYRDDVTVVDAVVKKNGKKMRPPRYYDQLLEKHDPALMQNIKDTRLTRAKDLDGDNTPHRLATKEKVARARRRLKQRNYEGE